MASTSKKQQLLKDSTAVGDMEENVPCVQTNLGGNLMSLKKQLFIKTQN